MAIYALERGLVLKVGDASWQVQRVLDRNSVQLEHLTTGRIRRERLSKLTHEIASGKITIEHGSALDIKKYTADFEGSVFCADSLKEHHKTAYLRASEYVTAMRKRGIAKGQRTRIANAITSVASELGDRNPPKSSTVMRWMRLYESSGRNTTSLVSGNVHRRRRSGISDKASAIAKDILRQRYFVRDGCSLASAHDRITAELERAADVGVIEQPEAQISLSTIRRIAREVTPYDRDRARLGPANARAKWRFSTHGKYATRPLERVEMDHTPLDLWVIDDALGIPLGRPTLTLLICGYSAYITGFFISFEGESLARIVRSLKIAIEPKEPLTAGASLENPWHAHGLWETLVIDNARACHSDQFKQIGFDLCMDVEYCPVRQPWFKPVVERYIGEACRQLPAPGRPQKPGRHPEPINATKNACVTFSDLCAGILKWVVDVHPFTINERKLARPIDLFLDGLDSCPAPMFVESYASLDVLAGVTASATVDQSGVVSHWIQYAGEDLRRLRNEIGTNFKTKYKFDPYDLGTMFVQHPKEGTWIYVPAKDQEYASGLTLTQHRLIRAACKERLSRANAEQVLRRARLELQDHWSSAISAGKRLKRAHHLALSQNQNSVDILHPRTHTKPQDLADLLIPDGELSFSERSVPDFGTFRLCET
ncbi:transposase [Paraburkholderia sp. GAS42]|uniref:transposase n=1 Tax=Paraburkholderia sp. GAS42 TaxID=3035135 RepID=UPI003D190840